MAPLAMWCAQAEGKLWLDDCKQAVADYLHASKVAITALATGSIYS